jgi:hypothetical protein
MATFASQISNLSALTSALGSFSRILELSEDNDDDVAEEQVREDAETFLGNQRQRISTIEQQLFHATKDVLPKTTESMTITELAELCRCVQETNRRQMEQLKALFEAAGIQVPWDERWSKETLLSPKDDSNLHWSLGRPLERVVEADTETDATTTPGSTATFLSPFNRGSSKKYPLTPTTPTMDSFSFRYVHCFGCLNNMCRFFP